VTEHHTAWLLDLDGTLYRAAPVKRMMAVELLLRGWGAVPTLRRFRHEHERLRATLDERIESPFMRQVEETAQALGKSREVVRSAVQLWMVERPQRWIERFTRTDLVAEVSEFHRAGGKLAVVSDYPASLKLAAVRGLPNIEVVVANGEPGGPGRLKPHPDGYLEAARRLQVAPDHCLVIGDREDADGEAARRAGMAFRLVGS
jgi:phosphoglycolate phosphatase/putative hydrolase of the HAD superfamily